MQTKRKPANRTPSKSTHITPELHEKVALYSEKTGISITRIVNDAIVKHLTELGEL